MYKWIINDDGYTVIDTTADNLPVAVCRDRFIAAMICAALNSLMWRHRQRDKQ